jgi:hypothetical protein
MVDPRTQESVTYALRVIEETPSNLPVLLFANFQDVPDIPDIGPTFARFSDRCVQIPSSMVTNLGLVELSRWLDLPLAARVYRVYLQLHQETDREIQRLQSMFAPGRQKSHSPAYDSFWSDGEAAMRAEVVSLYPESTETVRSKEPQKAADDDPLMSQIVESARAQKVNDLFDDLAVETEGKESGG